MTQAHTPGPWRAQGEVITCRGKWRDEEGAHFDWTYPHILAEVVDDWDYKANAALIAAAPELLKALANILYAHDTGNNGAAMGEASLCFQYAEAARAAIAKARGRP